MNRSYVYCLLPVRWAIVLGCLLVFSVRIMVFLSLLLQRDQAFLLFFCLNRRKRVISCLVYSFALQGHIVCMASARGRSIGINAFSFKDRLVAFLTVFLKHNCSCAVSLSSIEYDHLICRTPLWEASQHVFLKK